MLRLARKVVESRGLAHRPQAVARSGEWASCSTSGRSMGDWRAGLESHETEEESHQLSSPYGESRAATPWVRSVIVGAPLMRNPKYNKGLAFSEVERDRLYLRGLMPPAVMTQEVQKERVLANLNVMETDFEKYLYLSSLQDRNERLFYRVLTDHIEELLPIVHEPTMGRACLKYGLMFKNMPRGLFISLKDRGYVRGIFKNWPERRVRAIAITDGENILGLGDLGIQGMGSSVATLACYTACAGVVPHFTLPVTLDVGCNNDGLLKSPFYVGLKRRRAVGESVTLLWDEVIGAAQRRYGNSVVIHLHHMEPRMAERILARHRSTASIFSDEIQAFPATVLAGLMAAAPLTDRTLESHTFMVVGDGDMPAHLAEMITYHLARTKGLPAASVRQQVFLVDSGGVLNRARANTLSEAQLLYANVGESAATLEEAVKKFKPSVLIGCSLSNRGAGESPSNLLFNATICEEMAALNRRPIIFSLSTPEQDALAENVYRWTQGRAVFAGRDHGVSVKLPSGAELAPRPCLSALVFPGIVLGCNASGAVRIHQDMFLAAAEAVASFVTEEDRARGAVFPSLSKSRELAAHVTRKVAEIAYKDGVASNLPRPVNLLEYAKLVMYDTRYRPYR